MAPCNYRVSVLYKLNPGQMFHNYLRRTGFQRQLTVIVSAAIIGLALFSSLMNSWEASSRMRDYFIEQGQRVAENLARQSTLALLFHSAENARAVVASTLAFPDVVGLQISDSAHRVLLVQMRSGARLDATPPLNSHSGHASLIGETSEAWMFGAPVYGEQIEASPFDVQERQPQPQLLGFVHLQVGKNTLQRLTMSLLVGNLVLTLSFAAILLGLMLLLSRHMITPLNALSTLMRRAASGESGMRAAPAGPRDLIDMAFAFNQMINVLEQREAELKDSRDAAVSMALMKAQFAATVSHEVRTPLNGVVGMLDMLKEMNLNQRQQECVDVAWNSSRTLIELVNNILDFSKMEAGKLKLEELDFDLRLLLEEVIELVRKPAHPVELGYLFGPGVPERINGDSLRLRQILINLLGNAVKFTERGAVAVRVMRSDTARFGLSFEVRDSGIGMSQEAQQHLFEAFVQPDPSTTRKYGGTGLGLAICKQLVELLGGEIGVTSSLGVGTTFMFSICCKAALSQTAATPTQAKAAVRVLPAEPHGAEPEHRTQASATARQRYRVLVAEDNRTNQIVAAGMLAMHGCICAFAANGREAVDAALSSQFDLILMDCSMPEMDGYEATARIRSGEQALGRRTPLVAMTANTQPGDSEKCILAGMDDYLAKPITLAELRQKLEQWLPPDTPEPRALALAERSAEAVDEAVNEALDASALDSVTFNQLREILGAALPQAIAPFLEDTPLGLAELEAAVQRGDAEMARAKAHALKGSAANLGARALAQLAHEAEQLALAGQLGAVTPLLPRLRACYDSLAVFLAGVVCGEEAAAPLETLAQVLIVDDDRSTRSTLRYILQRDGFQVEEAADGAQALAMLKRIQPDVILMDAMMPVMDGFTACARMQELPGGSAIPVLMITALQDDSSVERAFAAGASDYIPKPIHYAVLSQRVRRIIEANRAEKRIRHLAYNDLLTGLPNRTLFFELLTQSIEQTGAKDGLLAVLFMDLDRFKYVNDNLGHDVGDRLLVAVAQRVRRSVRMVDTVARLGGDEFTVVLSDIDSPAAAATVAHNICRVLAAPFQIDGHDIFVTSSVGIAIYPHDGADVATLIKHADHAMYRAKKTNTGFQFFEASMKQSISEYVRMESDLRRALEHHQLEVYYQPQATLDTGQIIGMEALVRWRHPTRGMVPPVEFVALAEETGLINQLGDWVLRTACAQLQQWITQGLPPLRIAVNLSVRQLLQKQFAASVEVMLADTGLAPHLLELEITESTMMEYAQDTLKALHHLRALGVRLSIDDFGTGYSSLSYLKRFPVDIIKIDRSFVRDLPQDADDVAIVSAIIALAHSLRLKVVAEGVETKAQLQFLQAQQCDLLQGYYLSPAIPAQQFEQLIRQRAARLEQSSEWLLD